MVFYVHRRKPDKQLDAWPYIKPRPPKILKTLPIFAGSLPLFFLHGQKSLPSSLPASKDAGKDRFSDSTRGKDGHFPFGVYMYYIHPIGTPPFLPLAEYSYSIFARSLPHICPAFSKFCPILLAEKLIEFQDFPVIAKQRCYKFIVLL